MRQRGNNEGTPEALTIRPLHPGDASALSAMLQAQPPEYMRHFIPFSFDEPTIAEILSTARRDLYMGIYWEDALVGFFMLRGWDEEYEVPAYGVAIDHRFRGSGLARLSLEASKAICRLRGARRLMLKVHEKNSAAKRLYEDAGFTQYGVDQKNDNLIYHLDLVRTSGQP